MPSAGTRASARKSKSVLLRSTKPAQAVLGNTDPSDAEIRMHSITAAANFLKNGGDANAGEVFGLAAIFFDYIKDGTLPDSGGHADDGGGGDDDNGGGGDDTDDASKGEAGAGVSSNAGGV